VQAHYHGLSPVKWSRRIGQIAESAKLPNALALSRQQPESLEFLSLFSLNDDGRSRESRAIEQDSNIFAVIEEDQNGHYINLKYTRSCPRTRIPVTFRREFTRFEGASAFSA
jgi:hypothetical protein